MPITIRRTFGNLRDTALLTRDDMRDAGEYARQMVIMRTRMLHQDSDGREFTPYSVGYAKRRQDAGLPGDPPTLTVSGAMLDALRVVDVTDRSVSIGYL